MPNTRVIIFDNTDERFLAHVFFGHKKMEFLCGNVPDTKN